MSAHPQRAFRFGATRLPTLESFLPGANGELLTRLTTLRGEAEDEPQDKNKNDSGADRDKGNGKDKDKGIDKGGVTEGFVGVWLYAEDCIGKTHLLRAVARSDRYLQLSPTRAAQQLATLPVTGLRTLGPLALDDLERCLGCRVAEETLMGLYQAHFAAGVPLLVSSRRSPRALEPLLPDLASRFRAFETFALAAPGEAEQRLILQRQARVRGLDLSPDVLDFWLLRTARSLRSRQEDLALAVDYALGAQRPLTVPLLKEALGL